MQTPANVKKWFTILAFFLTILPGCTQQANQGDEIFKQYILPTIPSDIKIIEGKSNNLLETSAYVVFKAERKRFKQLTNGYEPFAFANALIQSADWFHKDVKEAGNPMCFYKSEKVDGKKNEYWLFYIKKTRTAYFNFIRY